MNKLFEDLYLMEEAKDPHTITIVCNKSAAEAIEPLLQELKSMCSMGSSRSIKIEDWDGNSNFGIDGDGPDYIESVKLKKGK